MIQSLHHLASTPNFSFEPMEVALCGVELAACARQCVIGLVELMLKILHASHRLPVLFGQLGHTTIRLFKHLTQRSVLCLQPIHLRGCSTDLIVILLHRSLQSTSKCICASKTL